jgi:hypothetical protein
MERKRRKEWPALTVLLVVALVLVPPVLYLCGYFWLPEVEEGYWVPGNIPVVHRTYRAEWLETIYLPMGRLEERLMGHEVEIGHGDEWASP